MISPLALYTRPFLIFYMFRINRARILVRSYIRMAPFFSISICRHFFLKIYVLCRAPRACLRVAQYTGPRRSINKMSQSPTHSAEDIGRGPPRRNTNLLLYRNEQTIARSIYSYTGCMY